MNITQQVEDNILLLQEDPLYQTQDYGLVKWRRQVFLRDTHLLGELLCIMCKRPNPLSSLHAHHINPASLFPQEKYDVVNGVTLCPMCHIGIVHLGNTFVDMAKTHNYRFFMPSFFDWTNSEDANDWYESIAL